MLPLPVILESQDDMSVVDGATIEPRIRINRPDDENTRCRVSRVRVQPKNFSQLTQPPTTLSTSNVISFLQGRTEHFARRLRTCGARQSRSFENIQGAEFSCSSFNDVTTPEEDSTQRVVTLSVRYPTQRFESVRNLRQCGAHLVADNGVTLACHVFESLAVNNNDPAPTILNDACLFEL